MICRSRKTLLDTALLTVCCFVVSCFYRLLFSDDTYSQFVNYAMYLAHDVRTYIHHSETLSPGFAWMVERTIDYFGFSLFFIHVITLLLHILSAVCLRFFLGLFLSRKTALIACLIFVFHPLVLFYLNSASSETVLVFFIIKAFLVWEMAERSKNWIWYAVFTVVVLIGSTIGFEMLAFVAAAALAVVLKKRLKKLSLVFFVLFVCWFVVAYFEMVKIQDVRLLRIFNLPLSILKIKPLTGRIVCSVITLCLVSGLLPFLIGFFVSVKKSRFLIVSVFTFLVLFVEICLASESDGGTGPHHFRHLTAAVPGVIIVACLGWGRFCAWLRLKADKKNRRKCFAGFLMVTIGCYFAAMGYVGLRTVPVHGSCGLFTLQKVDKVFSQIQTEVKKIGSSDAIAAEKLVIQTRAKIRRQAYGHYHPIDIKFLEGAGFDKSYLIFFSGQYIKGNADFVFSDMFKSEDVTTDGSHVSVKSGKTGTVVLTAKLKKSPKSFYLCFDGRLMRPDDKFSYEYSFDGKNWLKGESFSWQPLSLAYGKEYECSTDSKILLIKLKLTGGTKLQFLPGRVLRGGIKCLGLGVNYSEK